MDKCNLDWKKVFKEILAGENLPVQNNITSSESKQEQCSNVAVNSDSEKSSVSSSSYTLKASNNLYKDNISCYTTDKTKHKTFSSRKESSVKYFTCHSDSKQTDILNRDEVPEWNKAFKCILGDNSAKDTKEQNNIKYTLKKPDTSQKQNVPSKSKKCCGKEKRVDSKLKIDEEEKKVREILAQSRLFKLECSFSNLNDLAGCGVDIFKCGKKLFPSKFEKKSESEINDLSGYKVNNFKCDKMISPSSEKITEDEPDVYNNSYDEFPELDFPLEGSVANIKPMTREDILNSPCVPLTEVWDDDLLF